MSGGAQTYLGAAHTHFGSFYALFGLVMDTTSFYKPNTVHSMGQKCVWAASIIVQKKMNGGPRPTKKQGQQLPMGTYNISAMSNG